MDAFVYLANAVTVIVACGPVWVRRDAFQSRWDRPITVGVALYAAGALLDSPWPAAAAASFPATGKYYLVPALGQICFLIGGVAGLKSGFMRILPDDEVGPFMRARILPVAATAVGVMAVCVIVSPATSVMSADYLYQVTPDIWLTAYFTTYFLAMTGLMAVVIWGLLQLRGGEPQSPAVAPLLVGAGIGFVAYPAFLTAILTNRAELVPMVVWPISYTGITVASLACAFSWRHRASALGGYR